MDIYSVLHDEHQYVLGLLSKLESARKDSRKDLLEEISVALTSHTKAEEATLYTPLREVAEDVIGEGFEEHHVANVVLGELMLLSDDDEAFLPKAKVLHELVSHHVEEEESEVFSVARRVFDADVAEGIANEFLATKQELMETPSLLQLGKQKIEQLVETVTHAIAR